MDIELSEDLCRVEQMDVVEDSEDALMLVFRARRAADCGMYFFALNANKGKFNNTAIQYPLMRKSVVRKA